jgi:hypothetical protein
VCIVGGKNKHLYRNINSFINELRNERENITIIENQTGGNNSRSQISSHQQTIEEFLSAIIYSNIQANIVVS